MFVEKNVPSTTKVYNCHTISECLNDFDVFIVGSDQVWTASLFEKAYNLDFVPKEKYKISYAAGGLDGKLAKRQKRKFQKSLKTFNAVSVREKSAVETLSPLTNTQVEWVLDPTLLLTEDNWNEVCGERKINEKYIFCYFLGRLSLDNKEIIDFAIKRNLKVVTMPYLAGDAGADGCFGDYKIYDAGPEDFLSLIKYAEFVFTDSFHATVFSHIYKKDFFVFNRVEFNAMNDRIYSLTSLFDTQERFCDTKEKISLDYIGNLDSIDYSKVFPKFEELREKSINFLRENLKRCKCE